MDVRVAATTVAGPLRHARQMEFCHNSKLLYIRDEHGLAAGRRCTRAVGAVFKNVLAAHRAMNLAVEAHPHKVASHRQRACSCLVIGRIGHDGRLLIDANAVGACNEFAWMT